jgi:hypothetical protein
VRSRDHLLLELLDSEGRCVAGQWMRDGAELERVAAETMERCSAAPVATLRHAGGALLLQPRGADRVLVALHRILSLPGAELLAHRPERRGVVRLLNTRSEDVRYVKVVPSDRVDRVIAPLRALSGRAIGFRVPQLLPASHDEGQVVLASLPGRSLHDLVSDRAGLVDGARRAGRAVRCLHALDGLPLQRYRPERVVQELVRRIDQLAAFRPSIAALLAACMPSVTHGLEESRSPVLPVHRDLHDKQIVLAEDGGVGILDFDTLSLGESAVDVSNVLAHFELRALQAVCPMATAREAAIAFLDGYRPDDVTAARLQPYLDATRLRLACLYALRPIWPDLHQQLIARVGSTSCDCSLSGPESR